MQKTSTEIGKQGSLWIKPLNLLRLGGSGLKRDLLALCLRGERWGLTLSCAVSGSRKSEREREMQEKKDPQPKSASSLGKVGQISQWLTVCFSSVCFCVFLCSCVCVCPSLVSCCFHASKLISALSAVLES